MGWCEVLDVGPAQATQAGEADPKPAAHESCQIGFDQARPPLRSITVSRHHWESKPEMSSSNAVLSSPRAEATREPRPEANAQAAGEHLTASCPE